MLEPYSSVRARWLAAAKTSDATKVSLVALQPAILDEVRRGNFIPPKWVDVPIEVKGLGTAFVAVMADALRIGVPGDFVRVCVSAKTSQALADILGYERTTPKLDDAAYHFAEHKLEPIFVQDAQQHARSDMGAMETHSASITSKLVQLGAHEGELVRGVGKGWEASRLVTKTQAVNYGYPTQKPAGLDGKRPWPAATALGARVWQPTANKHDRSHVDGSQTEVGALRDVRVVDAQGVESTRQLAALAADSKLWPFVSHEGPLSMHDPWLPVCQPLDAGGSCPPGGTGGTPPPKPEPAGIGWLLRVFPFAAATSTLAFLVMRWERRA